MVNLITAALTLGSKVMDKNPDFSEKEKKEFNKLRKLYNEEINKPINDRDVSLILNVRDELQRTIEIINQKI